MGIVPHIAAGNISFIMYIIEHNLNERPHGLQSTCVNMYLDTYSYVVIIVARQLLYHGDNVDLYVICTIL